MRSKGEGWISSKTNGKEEAIGEMRRGERGGGEGENGKGKGDGSEII